MSSSKVLKPFKIVDGVYWVGVKDWSRRIFDSLIPLPKGTSYNAYLVVGSNSTALIDTVNPGFEEEFVERIRDIIDPRDVDYVIMNHAEPDHAGAVPYILNIASRSKLIASSLGFRMAKTFYKVSDGRIHVVRDGDEIRLGSKTLKFIEAPMLHWPETIFTFLKEDNILFSCDFFGAHVAMGMWDDEVEDLIVHAQRYWGEIMMPFRLNAFRALEKISSLDIKVIAPSHGPIYRNPKKIIEKYLEWSEGRTKEKIMIIYVSMWGYTREIVKLIEDTALSNNVEVIIHDLAYADLGDIAKDLADSRAVILATPTIIGLAHPLAMQAAYLLKILKPPVKYGGLIVTYAWGSNADRQLTEVLKDSGIEVIDIVKINIGLTEERIKLTKEFTDKILKKVMSGS